MSIVWQPSLSHPEFQVVKDLVFGIVGTMDGWETSSITTKEQAEALLQIPGCPFEQELKEIIKKGVSP